MKFLIRNTDYAIRALVLLAKGREGCVWSREVSDI